MDKRSIPTRGRTLDHAAAIYDFCEPLIMLGRLPAILSRTITILNPAPHERILDIGCGTGQLTALIAGRLDQGQDGYCMGIDAAARMIDIALSRRATATCRFRIAAAEELPFKNETFDAAVSSFFFHHVNFELKQRSLAEINRVLRPGGRLVILDMHRPDSFSGTVVSHMSRWLFLQPEIGENMRGVLPSLISEAGFSPPRLAANDLGYLATFVTQKPLEAA